MALPLAKLLVLAALAAAATTGGKHAWSSSALRRLHSDDLGTHDPLKSSSATVFEASVPLPPPAGRILRLTRPGVFAAQDGDSNQMPPVRLWQTYKSKDLPVDAERAQMTWRIGNPNMQLAMQDDAEADEFVRRHFTEEVYQVRRSGCALQGTYHTLFRSNIRLSNSIHINGYEPTAWN